MSGTAPSEPSSDAQRAAVIASDMGNNNNTLAPEDGGAAAAQGQGQNLLQVPSRSSSQQKGQPTITAAGQGGTSAGRSSTSGRSKDSKNSLVEAQGNGTLSAATNREGDPSATSGHTQPSSPSASDQKQRKKKGGLLSLFGCCVVPDSSNAVEADKENVHKLDKLPQRPTTAKSRNPAVQDAHAARQSNEKTQPAAATADQHGASSASQDVIMDEGDAHKSTAPALNVEPPSSPQTASGGLSADQDDTEMPDAADEEPTHAHAHPHAHTAESSEEPEDRTIPPPPPGPGQAVTTAYPVVEPAEEPRKWLLPPLAPEHKGRKCLVLDLDETLVHSSFKVRLVYPRFISICCASIY